MRDSNPIPRELILEGNRLRKQAEDHHANKPFQKRKGSNWRAFQHYCNRAGHDYSALTYDSVSGFLCAHVARCKSTATLSQKLSMLKTYSYSLQIPWLSDWDQTRLSTLVHELKWADSKMPQRKRAIRFDDLMTLSKGWNLNQKSDLRIATMFTMAFQGLLRSGELLSGIRAGDIRWGSDRRSFQLWLRRTKTVFSGSGVCIGYKYRQGASLFAGDFLKKWFDMNDLWGKPKSLLFPSPHKKPDGLETTYSTG